MREATRRLLITVLGVLIPLVGLADQRRGAKPSNEILHIDGSKNPELVPQWSVWESCFGLFAGGKKVLPTVLLRQLSAEEPAIVLKAAEAHVKREAEFINDAERLGQQWTKEKAKAMDEELWRIKLDYRRDVLSTRDRLLAALGPESRAALTQFVEGTKASMKITLRKIDLAKFLQPE